MAAYKCNKIHSLVSEIKHNTYGRTDTAPGYIMS